MKTEINKFNVVADEETSTNMDMMQKMCSQPILFDQPIILVHLLSGKFLAFDTNTSSQYESENFKAYLAEEYGDHSIFKIIPAFAHQREGQIHITGGDQAFISIENTTENKQDGSFYLHASKVKDSTKNSNVFYKKEMNLSMEKDVPWK